MSIPLDVLKYILMMAIRLGDLEAVPSDCHKGITWPCRNEARKGQQGNRGVQHHVHRGPISALLEGTLEIPEDRSQQAV